MKEGFIALLERLKRHENNSMLHKPERELIKESREMIEYLDSQIRIYVKLYHKAEKQKVDAQLELDSLKVAIESHYEYCPLTINID